MTSNQIYFNKKRNKIKEGYLLKSSKNSMQKEKDS
jgi:hypothetical protein